MWPGVPFLFCLVLLQQPKGKIERRVLSFGAKEEGMTFRKEDVSFILPF